MNVYLLKMKHNRNAAFEETLVLIHIYLIAKQEVNADMCYTHLSWVFRRLNMLPVSRFQNFLCPGSDDGSSSNKSGRWNASKVYYQ